MHQFDTDDSIIVDRVPPPASDPLYREALETDVITKARRLVVACRASDKRRNGLAQKIVEGNKSGMFGEEGTKKGVFIRDVDTRWSSTYSMIDRMIEIYPVSSCH